MKNRFLSLILLLCLLWVPVQAAEEDAAAKAEDSRTVRVIKGLGIMQGYEDGSFQPEDILTRAEFAQCIAVFFESAQASDSLTDINTAIWNEEFHGISAEDAETQAATAVGSFSDVPVTHWAYAAVQTVFVNGIMVGTGTGLFEPDRPVLVQEAVKTMVCLLGYRANAEVRGGYPTGYLLSGNDLHLTRGIDLPAQDGLTRGGVAQLLYNALDVPVQEAGVIGSGYTEFAPSDETLLSKMLHIDTVRGELTDNGVTTYQGRSALKKSQVQIGGIIMDLPEGYEDLRDQIGSLMEAYYRFDEDGGPNELVYAEVTENEEAVWIAAEDLAGFDGRAIRYETGGRLGSETIPAGTFVIYNGSAVAALTPEMLEMTSGWVKVIRNTSPLVVIKNYRAVYASNVDTEEGSIYDKLNPASPISFDPAGADEYLYIQNADGSRAEVDTLGANTAMLVADSEYALEILLCDTAVQGTVDAISQDGEAKIEVNGTTYRFSKEYLASEQALRLSPGETVSLSLSPDGHVIWAVSGAVATGTQFGFIAASKKVSGLTGGWKLKIFTNTGSMAVYDVAERLTISDTYNESHRLEGDQQNSYLEGLTGFVSFSLDSEDNIRELQLPLEESSDAARLYKIFEINDANMGMMYYKSGTKTFGYRLNITAATQVINVPIDLESAVDDDFKLLSTGFFLDNQQYRVTGYTTVPNSKTAQYLVYRGSSTSFMDNSDKLAVVTKITRALDGDGEVRDVLYANKAGSEIKLFEGDGVSFGAVQPGVSDGNTYQLEAGDIIRYITNADGEVSEIYLIYDANMENPSGGSPGYLPGSTEKYYIKSDYIDLENNENHMYDNVPTYGAGVALRNGNPYGQLGQSDTPGHWFMREQRVMLGYALSKDEVSTTVTTQDMTVYPQYYENGIPEGATVENGFVGVFVTDVIRFDGSSCRVDVVELRDKDVSVRMGSLSDVKTYADAGSECSKLLVASNYGDVVHVIIIQDFR